MRRRRPPQTTYRSRSKIVYARLSRTLASRRGSRARYLFTIFVALRNHRPKLTLFLRVPGAPIDNNICGRKLFSIRKNSLFYRTKNGAQVGDLFMSLIYLVSSL
ncbi:MAG: hypothetical protein DMF61_21115 [Blastocatellia bacterium AA13]|nr:MAG: hypothetical protein DMF61_21115 [Blastocatellia bacterium AA13]